MPSLPLGTTHGRQRRAWHAIIALGRQTRSDDVRHDMPSPPLDSTHGRTMSGVALHHRPWTARMVRRRQAWYDITALGQHTRSNDVGRGLPSLPLGSSHGRTTSGVACHHRPWTTHTVGRRRAWNDIIALGQHTRSDYVGRGMTSPPLDSTHSRTTSGVAFHHRLWAAHTVERRRA